MTAAPSRCSMVEPIARSGALLRSEHFLVDTIFDLWIAFIVSFQVPEQFWTYYFRPTTLPNIKVVPVNCVILSRFASFRSIDAIRNPRLANRNERSNSLKGQLPSRAVAASLELSLLVMRFWKRRLEEQV